VTVADTLISSVKVLAALAWLKQMDLAGHWLPQHTAPVRAKPDSRPCLEEACSHSYLAPSSVRHTHTACSYQFPSFPELAHWTVTYGLSAELHK